LYKNAPFVATPFVHFDLGYDGLFDFGEASSWGTTKRSPE